MEQKGQLKKYKENGRKKQEKEAKGEKNKRIKQKGNKINDVQNWIQTQF